jgi:hypothetical protein
VFLKIYSQLGLQKKLAFNPIVVLAVSAPLAQEMPDAMSVGVRELSQRTHAQLSGWKRRPWGIPIFEGSAGYSSIQSLDHQDLLKEERRYTGPVDSGLLQDDTWHLLDSPGSAS